MAVKMLRALAVARGEPARTRVITLLPGYHDATAHTLAMNGDADAGDLWDPLARPATRISAPLTFRAPSPRAAARASLAKLEAALLRLGPESVLAFVMEPIGGQASGVNVPDPTFARGARVRCDRYGVALVFDEVVTAFRTGAVLAAQHDPRARPDLVTMAKGLGAGYAPLGAVLTSSAVAEDLAGSTGFVVSPSYDACPMSCAAGCAVLDEIVDRGLVAHAASVGARIRAGLERIAADSPIVGDVRGKGLLLAVELVTDRATAARFPPDVDPGAALLRRGLDVGLLLYSRRQNHGRFGDWLLVAPPLVIDDATADRMLDRLYQVLLATPDQLC